MNRVLGGGGFTSRIMARVRSDEGLAYAASSSLRGGVYYPPPFVASFQTKSRTVAYATSIVLEEMRRIAAEPVANDELDTAKRYLIDVFPRVFASKAETTSRFAQDEFTGRYQREPDYWKQYRDRIESVSVKNVQKAAQDHLALSNVVILVVGDKAEILKGHPDHDVSLESLASGKVNTVPLRDPMTMKPVTD
jgi:zinc protease